MRFVPLNEEEQEKKWTFVPLESKAPPPPPATNASLPGFSDQMVDDLGGVLNPQVGDVKPGLLQRRMQGHPLDPMIRPEAVEALRSSFASVDEAQRMPMLREIAAGNDGRARAARVILKEEESLQRQERLLAQQNPEMMRAAKSAPGPAGGGSGGAGAPARVRIQDTSPTLSEIADMKSQDEILANRRAQSKVLDTETGLSAIQGRAANQLSVRGGIADAAPDKEGAFEGAIGSFKPLEALGFDMSLGDAVISAAKVAPTAVELGAKALAWAAQFNSNEDPRDSLTYQTFSSVAEAAERVNKIFDNAKSREARQRAAELGRTIADPNASWVDVAGYIIRNPELAAEFALESSGTMLPALLAAKGAGAAAARLSAKVIGGAAPVGRVGAEIGRVSTAAAGAGAGAANVAMGAGAVYDETLKNGGTVEQANLAAVTTGIGYYLMGRLTGGGAEGALVTGARGAVQTTAREGFQEGGESLSESIAQDLAMGRPVDIESALKQAVPDVVAGIGIGGAVGGAQALADAMPGLQVAREINAGASAWDQRARGIIESRLAGAEEKGAAPLPTAADLEAVARRGLGGERTTSFTPPESIVAQEGITPVTVPVPAQAAPVVQDRFGVTEEEVQAAEDEFGLTALRGSNARVPAVPGSDVGGGGAGGGLVSQGGMAAAGPVPAVPGRDDRGAGGALAGDAAPGPDADGGADPAAVKKAAEAVETAQRQVRAAEALGEPDTIEVARRRLASAQAAATQQATTGPYGNTTMRAGDVQLGGPAQPATNAERLEQFARNFSLAASRNPNLRRRLPQDLTPVSPEVADGLDAVSGGIAEVLGTNRVVLGESDQMGDGINFAGMSVVNVRGLEKPAVFVAIHESIHQQQDMAERAARPDATPEEREAAAIWNPVWETIWSLIPESERLRYANDALGMNGLPDPETGKKRPTAAEFLATPEGQREVMREMTADFGAKRLSEPETVKELARRNPEAFGPFAKKMIAYLGKVIKALRGSRRGLGPNDIDTHIKDLQQAKAVWQDAMLKWAARGGAKAQPASGRGTQPSMSGRGASARPYESAPDSLMGYRKDGPQKGFGEQRYRHVEFVRVTWEDGDSMVDAMAGLNKAHALERARRNWKDASDIQPISREEAEREDPGIGDTVDRMVSNSARISPQRQQKIDEAAAAAREYVPGYAVDDAVALVEQYPGAPEMVVPDADRARLEAEITPLIDRAKTLQPGFKTQVEALAGRLSAKPKVPGVKGLKRAAEKMYQEEREQGRPFDSAWLKDLVRGTIVVESMEEVAQAIEAAREAFNVTRVKDRFSKPTEAGYRDVLMNVDLGGMPAELQIHIPEMLAAKELGHLLYEVERSLPNGEEKTRLQEAQAKFYGAAFDAATGAEPALSQRLSSDRNSSRETASSSSSFSSTTPVMADLGDSPGSRTTGSSSLAKNLAPSGSSLGSITSGSIRGTSAPADIVNRQSPSNSARVEDSEEFNDDAMGQSRGQPPFPTAIDDAAALSTNMRLARSKNWRRGRDLKVAMQTAVIRAARAAGVNPRVRSPQAIEYLTRVGVRDALDALKANANAIGWYDLKTRQALSVVSLIHPELVTDPNSRLAFVWALAVTSNGLKVDKNFELAERAYRHYKRNGSMPTDLTAGQAQKAINDSLGLFDALRKEWGIDNLRKFMLSNFTVGEIGNINPDLKPGGEHVDVTVRGAAILGPKIGNGFFSNLYGSFDALTMDRWLIRTWGRWSGTLLSKQKAQTETARARLTDAIKAVASSPADQSRLSRVLGKLIGPNTPADELAPRIAKASMDPEDRAEMNRSAIGSELRLAGNGLSKYLDGQKEAPGGPNERKYIREVFGRILGELRQRPEYEGLTMADLQAVLWYAEKRLYEAAKTQDQDSAADGYEDDEAPDYANAAAAVAQKRGVSMTRIKAALAAEEAKSGRPADARLPAEQEPAGREGVAEAARGFAEGERAEFLSEQRDARTLREERAKPKRARVVFEVAPDPNNKALADAWRSLAAARRAEISRRIARKIAPQVLAAIDNGGIFLDQVGSYLDDTNPSFALMLSRGGDAVEAAKLLGFVLSQDSMVVVSPKKVKDASETGAVVIDVGDKTPDEIDAIYQKLRAIEVGGEWPVGGQSTVNGQMTVLNFSGVRTDQLASLVDDALGGAYSVVVHEVYAAFPEKKDYDYASPSSDPRGNRGLVRQRARDLRAEAQQALADELRGAGVSLSRRVGSDAAGGGRDRVLAEGQQGPAGQRKAYGVATPGAAAPIEAYHFSREPRTSLSSSAYGTGLRGAEAERLRGADPRLSQRVYFYFNQGTGIRPEAGVGPHAHRVTLQNLYDASEGRIKVPGGDANLFEAAVLDAGYDGYLVRLQGQQSGQAVLLGRHTVPVEYLGMGAPGDAAQAPAAPARARREGDELVSSAQLDPQAIRAKADVQAVAPSFRFEFGKARVKAAEADAANEVLAAAGSEVSFSRRLDEDLQEQRAFLDERARAAGYLNLDEFVDQDFDGFMKAAEEWRAMNPTDELVSASRRTTDSPEFKSWFRNSKVLDDEGQPLVVYHATAEDFAEFKPGGKDPSLSGHAIWFTDSKDSQPAAHNTSARGQPFRSGTRVIPVYLRMERPLLIDDRGMLEWAQQTFAGGSREFPQLMPKKWADEVTRDGEYDGVIFDGPAVGWRNAVREYIVFSPNQIKSAVGNSGAFDASKADISQSLRLVDPGSVLNAAVTRAADAVEKVLTSGRAQKLNLGRTPHVLSMLGAQPRALEMDESVVRKVFFEKHLGKLKGVAPQAIVEGLYRPAMVFKQKGAPNEFELVLPVATAGGPLTATVVVDRDRAAVKSIYPRSWLNPLSGPGVREFFTQSSVQSKPAYVDEYLSAIAATGNENARAQAGIGRRAGSPSDQRPGVNSSVASAAPLSPAQTPVGSGRKSIALPGRPVNREHFISWSDFRLISGKYKVPGESDLMRWIGDNFRGDWADAPSYSGRTLRSIDEGSPESEALQEFGYTPANMPALMQAWSDGARVFVSSEQDDGISEVLSQRVIEAGGFPMDRILVLPPGVSQSRRQTDTPEFKRWFGNSKVVDAEGKPLVVYHGTAADIDVFRGPIMWVAADPVKAESYAGRKDGANVMPVYVSIKNPLDLRSLWAGDMYGSELVEKLGLDKSRFSEGFLDLDSSRFRLINNPEFIRVVQELGYDGLVIDGDGWQQKDKTTWAVFRPEQIKSAIGNRGTFDPESPSISRSGRLGSSWKDDLGRVQFGPGAMAYNAVAKIANRVLNKFALKPIDKDLGRAIRKMKVEIERAQNLSIDVSEKLGKLSDAERQMISDVIEGELKAGVKPPKNILAAAAAISRIMSEQSAELVRLGMLDQDTASAYDGAYLPRFYEKHLGDEAKGWAKAAKRLLSRPGAMQGIKGNSLRARGIFKDIPVSELADWQAQGWMERDPNRNPADETVRIWRDFTRQEREQMGEIRDASFRFVMGYMRSQKDIALGRLYESLASSIAQKRQPLEGEWVQVPATNVGDGVNVRRYGRLAGMWVPAEVMDHLSDQDRSFDNELLQIYRKGLSMWKEGKVVLNPVSHANNVISNLITSHFAGVSLWDAHKYALAARDLIKRDPMVTEAQEAGLFGGTFSTEELAKNLPDQLKILAQKQETALARGIDKTWTALSLFLRKPAGIAYEAEDKFFRYLVYRDARKNGLSPDDAVDYAQKFIFAYDDLPRGARVIRDTVLPFFSYTYKAIPMLAETALKYPWRYATPAALVYGANAAAYAIAAAAGEEDDLEEIVRRYFTDPEFRAKAQAMEKAESENLPPWMQGHGMAMGVKKTIRLGVDETTDLPVFLDVARWIPGGDIFDVTANAGGLPLPAPLTPGNPLLTLFTGLIGNKDLFTGKDLVNKQLDSDSEAAFIRGQWAWRQITPAVAPMNYHFDRILQTIAAHTDQPITFGPFDYTGTNRDGLPAQVSYTAMQTFGIKARPIDLEMSADIKDGQTKALIREIDAEMRRIRRLMDKGAMSDEAGERALERERTKKDRLRDGMDVDGDPRP